MSEGLYAHGGLALHGRKAAGDDRLRAEHPLRVDADAGRLGAAVHDGRVVSPAALLAALLAAKAATLLATLLATTLLAATLLGAESATALLTTAVELTAGNP
jgi:hypothetical protein